MTSKLNNAKTATDKIKQDSICYVGDSHVYYFLEEKLERLKLEIPNHKSLQEDLFKMHADLVEERKQYAQVDREEPAPANVLQMMINRAIWKQGSAGGKAAGDGR
jgi:hypothetical protein